MSGDTEKLNVLVLANGATINLDGATVKNVSVQIPLELEVEAPLVLEEENNLGCDPMNSADRLKPQVRRVHCERARSSAAVRRERNKKIPIQNGGLSDASLDWLESFFNIGVLSHA